MKLWQKITIGVVSTIVVLAAGLGIAVACLWGNELASLSTLVKIVDTDDENYSGPVYQMTIKGGYYFDDFIEQGGAASDQELINFIVDNLTKGIIPVSLDAPTIGCASFTAKDTSGDRLFARNYDFSTTTSMIVYTDPGDDRHASVSSVDLQFLGIEGEIDGLMSKAISLAAPYVPLDGMNDAGVSCGIYMSYQGPGSGAVATDQNTEKPDLTSTTMLRLILDYADSVEEAVELVSQYDLHDSASTSFHYMVADSTGKSAILEWVNATDSTDTDGSARELHVYYNDGDELGGDEAENQFQYVTNFIVAPDYYESESSMFGLDRYNYIKESINPDGSNTEGVYSEADCLELLKSVGRRTWDGDTAGSTITVWSALYNLTDLTATWVSNEQFGEETMFTLSLA